MINWKGLYSWHYWMKVVSQVMQVMSYFLIFCLAVEVQELQQSLVLSVELRILHLKRTLEILQAVRIKFKRPVQMGVQKVLRLPASISHFSFFSPNSAFSHFTFNIDLFCCWIYSCSAEHRFENTNLRMQGTATFTFLCIIFPPFLLIHILLQGSSKGTVK